MKIKDNYSGLYNFLASWFPDADFEGLSDKDIVISFRKVSDVDKINNVINEISLLIRDDELSIEDIIQCTNIYFNDKEELINWLIEIKEYLSI